MPTFEGSDYLDAPKWDRCLKAAAKAMIEQGWNKHAKKFPEVQRRKARKIYYS